jgi:hypothetical protein
MRARHVLTVLAATAVGAALLAGPAAAAAPVRVDEPGATGTIEGTTFVADDGDRAGMRVSASPFDEGVGGEPVASVVSGAGGRFTLDVPPGEYLLTLHSTEFAYPSGSKPFDFDHYGSLNTASGQVQSTDRIAKATPVTVTAGGAVEDVLLIAWPDQQVEGQENNSDGSLLKGLVVSLYDTDGTVAGTYTLGSNARGSVDIVGTAGFYDISGLRTGTYRIGLNRGGVVDQPDAGSVTVTPQDRPNVAPTVTVKRYTQNTSLPTTGGTSPKIGAAMTATPGEWTQTEGVTWRYQWYMNGVALDAGKQATYTPTAGTLGKRLTVKATAVHKGDVVASATSKATAAVVRGTIEVVRPPVLAALRLPVVGDRIGRDLGYWKPSGLTWSYQWLRDGKAISGQRGAYYRLTAADWGKKVSLRVTGSRSGYTSQTRTTPAEVVKRAPSMSNTTTVLGGGKVRLTAKVVVTGTSRPSGRVDVYEDDELIGTIPSLTNGVGTITVSGRTPGTHRYTLEYSGNSLVTAASRTREVVVR